MKIDDGKGPRLVSGESVVIGVGTMSRYELAD